MEKQINIESIMEEIRENVKNRKYPREALDFEFVMQVDEPKAFDEEEFRTELHSIRFNMELRYDEPIQGKGILVKKIVKKLNQFYVKPLLEKQSRTNNAMLTLINQMGDYILQTERQLQDYEARIEYLEKKCGSLEK